MKRRVMSNTKTESETTNLMELLSKLPTATTEPTTEATKKSTKWRHRSVAPKNVGRVNRTKGK